MHGSMRLNMSSRPFSRALHISQKMDQVTKAIDELKVSSEKVVDKVDLKKDSQEDDNATLTVTAEEVDEKDAEEEDVDKEENDENENKEEPPNLVCVLEHIEDSQEIDIGFKVPHDEEYTSPYIDLGSRFQKSYDRCLELDEVVLPSDMIKNSDEHKFITLWLDYPLDDEYSFKIYPEDVSKGYTRGHLLKEIKRTYDKLYAEEEETSTLPVENIPGMLNRAATDGNYGVWGHALDDLVLHTISYNPEKNEIWLGIDS
ncbi:hypothetical protein CJU89_4029 [Yarrowia sp. B02]|nr:hypothetical protein CJU89_4029 [Yarrowia sp. B02]